MGKRHSSFGLEIEVEKMEKCLMRNAFATTGTAEEPGPSRMQGFSQGFRDSGGELRDQVCRWHLNI